MRSVPCACALAIGGLDPGGGAGLAADLRALTAAGAFGCAAVAVVTVQSTAGALAARALAAREVTAQAAEVLARQRVRAVKIGALGSEANVRAVARLLERYPRMPVVVDTPMTPTRGTARLLSRRALAAMREVLLPRAWVVTANAEEAASLVGEPVRTVGEAHDAARALVRMGAGAALVKGGHLAGPSATDVLALGGGHEVIELRAKRLATEPVHGTGCTLAALIAGKLAVQGASGARPGRTDLVAAVRWAKRVHHAALRRAIDVGGPARVLVFAGRERDVAPPAAQRAPRSNHRVQSMRANIASSRAPRAGSPVDTHATIPRR
jgi:hydroxymethylpyrimidine/phosphomethylpyrimidine kinase